MRHMQTLPRDCMNLNDPWTMPKRNNIASSCPLSCRSFHLLCHFVWFWYFCLRFRAFYHLCILNLLPQSIVPWQSTNLSDWRCSSGSFKDPGFNRFRSMSMKTDLLIHKWYQIVINRRCNEDINKSTELGTVMKLRHLHCAGHWSRLWPGKTIQPNGDKRNSAQALRNTVRCKLTPQECDSWCGFYLKLWMDIIGCSTRHNFTVIISDCTPVRLTLSQTHEVFQLSSICEAFQIWSKLYSIHLS